MGDKKSRVAGALGCRAADAVLQRPADGRSQFQRVNPGIEIAELAVQCLFQASSDGLALLEALGHDDSLGKIIVSQLYIQRQVKTNRALPDI